MSEKDKEFIEYLQREINYLENKAKEYRFENITIHDGFMIDAWHLKMALSKFKQINGINQ